MSALIDVWLQAAKSMVVSYRKMIDATVAQLNDEQFFSQPAEGFNSVANLLRHLGGNLRSRWTNFLTTDGEKPTRNRDSEFAEWEGDRDSLMLYFDSGWSKLEDAVDSMNGLSPETEILIRGEPHALAEALLRSLTHTSYHVGQICMVSRMVHEGSWQWLTIAPGRSKAHNQKTWGTKRARSVMGDEEE